MESNKRPELEKEANLFAMLLLMPKRFIKKDFEAGIDLGDDKALRVIAKKYDVSITALTVRMNYYIKHNI